MTSGTSTSVARRRLGADARREQLVEIGLALVKTRPFDQVSAEDVAQEAGVSKGLVFHYFPTTNALYVAILRASASELLARLDVDPEAVPAERLRKGVDAFVDYIEQQPESYRAIARGAGSDPDLLAVFEETRAAVVGIIQSAVGLTELPAGLSIAVRAWIAVVEESVLHWLDERPVPREELVDFLHRTALTLLADPIALRGVTFLPGP